MKLICLFIFISELQLCFAGCYEYYYSYRRTCDGWFGWWGCKTESSLHKRCCTTYHGYYCNIPKCRFWNNGYNSGRSSCDAQNEGIVIYKNGTKIRNSGGTCTSPARCINCNDGYYPTNKTGGYCKACPRLDNCNVPKCTSPYDVTCEYCVGEYIDNKPGYNVYTGLPDRKRCQEACSWRDGARCFPGSCGANYILDGVHEKCKCADGFGGKNCAFATANNTPNVLEMEMALRHGDDPPFIVDTLNSSHNAIFWTKTTTWSNIKLKLKSTYKPNVTVPSDSYITNYTIGVEYMDTTIILQRGETSATWKVNGDCVKYMEFCSNPSVQMALTSVTEWKPILDGDAFQHMDRITISMWTKNGGIVHFTDREGFDPSKYKQESYTLDGSATTETRHLIFDIYKPTHCLEQNDSCLYDALTVQDAIKQPTVTAYWSGWEDSVSGVASYTFHVYHLQMLNGSSGQGELSKGNMVTPETIVDATWSNVNLSLDEPGPIAIVLIVTDNAGNTNQARRIIMFDNASVVEKTGNMPKIIQAGQTRWINMTSSRIELQWTGRYRNIRHLNHGWLNAVAEEKTISRDLDDVPGRSFRTTAAIHNLQGIVRIEIARHDRIDDRDEFGDFKVVPLDYFNEQHMVYPTDLDDLVDGKQFIYSIRAFDVVDEFAEDNVTVMVDLSPPTIENFWLSNGDFVNISVHNVKELAELTFEFVTYDQHSGIDVIYWRIFDNYTNNVVVHGNSGASAQGETSTVEECEAKYGSYARGPNCYCSPYNGCYHQHHQIKPTITTTGDDGLHFGNHIGEHEFDYFIQVTVINNAGLKTTKYKKITIDVSPPTEGTVHDGMPGEPELDFQQSLQLAAYWDGYFDKESDVWFYTYGFHDICLNESTLDVHTIGIADIQVYQTYSTSAHFMVPTPGKYYITVMAYNHALDHSKTVCSDGVTINLMPAVVTEVVIKDAVICPRLLKDSLTGEVFVLQKNREIESVRDPFSACVENSLPVPSETLDLLPRRRTLNGSLSYTTLDSKCSLLQCQSTNLLSWITNDNIIDLFWNVSDTDQVHDFEVGIASDNNEFPDIFSFTTSRQHQYIRIYHPDIFNGELFFILIKSITKSMITDIKIIGPVVYDSSKPIFSGQIVLSVEESLLETFLVARWDIDAVSDDSGLESLTFETAIGTKKNAQDILPFSDITSGGSCTKRYPPNCSAFPTSMLPWHLHSEQHYVVTLKITNGAGLFVTESSKDYQHNTALPSSGIVHDIEVEPFSSEVFDIDDIDYQTDNTSLKCRWTGFHHPHEDITYTVCLTDNNKEKYVSCEKSNGDDQHVNLNLQLQQYVTYYQVVIAQTEAGNVSAISDGVTIVNDGDTFYGLSVYDGPNCNNSLNNVSDINLQTSHHDENKVTACHDDIDYQPSTSVLSSHWSILEDNMTYCNNIYLSVEEKAPVADFWSVYLDYQRLDTISFQAEITNLFLTSGRCYRTNIKLCASKYCYRPVYSDGVCVTSFPPSTGNIKVEYLENIQEINAVFDKFYDPEMAEINQARKVMDHYEWAIGEDSQVGRLFYKWTRIQPPLMHIIADEITATIKIDKTLPTDKCWRIFIRGYTQAGLSSVVSDELRKCSDVYKVAPNVVIDAIGDSVSPENKHAGYSIFLPKNAIWKYHDVDYTPYNNILSAVWPSLRHGDYNWAVLHIQNGDSTVFSCRKDLVSLKDPCSHPDAIKCGKTDKEFINVEFDDDVLNHGRRFIICIHAKKTVLHHGLWDQDFNEVSACSDGVTVDITPPVPGEVWIGNNKAHLFQTSTSEISVNWNSFIDVEEGGYAVHTSGITKYELAIGSSAGGSDVVTFTNVGLTNHKLFHDIRLQAGHTYFATVKGYDFTGQSSMSTSKAVKVDSSPPEVTESSIKLIGRHITDIHFVEACWNSMFTDDESGLSHYSWAVGTNPGTDDVIAFKDTIDTCGQTNIETEFELVEGHAYFISVRAYNKAGLFSSISSWAFVVDESAPLPGNVYDGPLVEGVYNDMDYFDNGMGLKAHWKGFVEQHSTLAEYFIQVGSCNTCSDIVSKQSVGLNNAIEMKHVRLSEGRRYYVTITACNTVDLCSSATSDGIVIDSTPPIRGVIIDGITSSDVIYQASTNSLACKWYGFIDPQSGISHYTWRVGTVRGGDDVLQTRNVMRHEEGFVLDYLSEYGHYLPVGVKMYCAIRAYNNAGKYSESSSNGFIIDNSAPVFTKTISQSPIGSIVLGTSVLRTVIKLYWDVQDKESFIETQHISISSHFGGDFNLSPKTIEGVTRDYTLTGLDLHDGSFYDVHIISCNGAKICAQSVVTILMDSTPPSTGTFAINTDHAADLDRQPNDWMTWTSISIKLAWLGFEDVHTGIESYMVNIGSRYMGSDLNEIPKKPFIIKHQFNESTEDLGNNRKVQTFEFRTQKLRTDTSIFISVSAYNKVGLRSGIIHSHFELVFGGFMALVRRCYTQTCLGHCVCAPHDQLCEFEDNLCNDVSGEENTNTLIDVEDCLDLTFPDASAQVSPTNTMLAAKWKVIKDQGAEPMWFEWSIGLTKYESPIGIFDIIKDRVWHDAGQSKLNVFTISRGKPNLQEEETYSYFVRVWYDDNTFAVFKSRGIQIYSTPPQTISILGKSVKEILFGGSKDVDFITRQSNVFADWSGKFNGVSAFRLYLSTTPTGHDFYTHSEDIKLDVTSFNISGLPYEENTKYFTIIQAFNLAGLHTTEVSDGFKLDIDPPTSGVVMDGFAITDRLASSDDHLMSSFWHSFADSGSGIVAYEYCISSNTISGSETCDIKSMTSVGIGTHTEYKPQLPFKQGQTLKGIVRALDAVGHVSNNVYSDGIIIDATAPVRVKQDKCDHNVVHDSSFEDLSLMHPGEICSLANSSYWQLSPGSCITAVNSTHAYHGLTKLHLRGSIYQNTDTTEGRYRLTFQTSIIPSHSLLTKSTAEGYISVNNDTQSFLLYQKPRSIVYAWQKHTFHFNIVSNRTKLLIGTVDNRQIAIDSVTFELCTASDDKTELPDSHVKAHTVFVHDWSSIYAEWWFVDAESPIVEYLWAIGTVKGGTQLQDFVNVGQRTHTSNYKLQLLHNTEVYITVVAVNAAGLRSISYSDAVIIDLTSPICNYVNDGNKHGSDIDYQKGLVVEVHWDITDSESGIQECQLAIGVNGKENYLQDYILISDDQSNATVTLDEIPIGMAYSTIRCTNFAGLTSKCVSDGVKIMEHPPTIDDVVLDLMTASETQFHPRGNYHGNKSEIRFRWTGFADDDGIESYLISLQGMSFSTTEIVKASQSVYDYASFIGLELTDGGYTVSVVAVNEIKMQSQRKSESFILLTQAPTITGTAITTSWNKQTSVASAHWDSTFSSQYPMFYEVTARMIDYGEGDILQWQETTNTFTENVLDSNEIPAGGVTVLFSVRAVGYSGLFEIAHGDLYVFL